MKVTLDRCFRQVMEGCAAPRPGQDGTWITEEMSDAYAHLFDLGHAHSVEAWLDDGLVGGLYGVALGRMFFGESMFSRVSDASKVALVALVARSSAGGFHVWTVRWPRAIWPRSVRGKSRVSCSCDTSAGSTRDGVPFPWRFDADLLDTMSRDSIRPVAENHLHRPSTEPRSDQKVERPRMWRVLLHNDDYTTQEFVVWVLESVFRKPRAEAVEVMLRVHLSGIGVAGIFTARCGGDQTEEDEADGRRAGVSAAGNDGA